MIPNVMDADERGNRLEFKQTEPPGNRGRHNLAQRTVPAHRSATISASDTHGLATDHSRHKRPLSKSQATATIARDRTLSMRLSPLATNALLVLITLQLELAHRCLVECTANSPCDFEKYSTGCFSNANLICDRETNTCQCHPDWPVLIQERFCVRRVKPHESCQYDDQCDTGEGVLCVRTSGHSDYPEACQPYSSSASPVKCRCLRVDQFGEEFGGANNKDPVSVFVVQDRAVAAEAATEADHRAHRLSAASQTHNATRARLAAGHREHNKAHGPHSKQTHEYDRGISKQQHSLPTSSIFSRIVWLFLILALLSLMLLLLVIRYHSSFGASERPFHHRTDDRVSVNNELDVPPPYEVAIRMKHRGTYLITPSSRTMSMLTSRKDADGRPPMAANKAACSSSSSGSSSIGSGSIAKNSSDIREQKPTLLTSTSSTSAKGQKRKSQEDPHDEKGSEFLRRKHGFIKSTIRVDYQPDICKDYKQTGFCGFGDSCKFLHDRSDYKHGWQLEQEYAKGQHKEEADDKYLIKDSDEEDEGAAERAKSECPVCNEPFKCAVETKCKHRFCEKCFDKECIETCFVCHKATGGVQNPVRDKPKTNVGQRKSRWK